MRLECMAAGMARLPPPWCSAWHQQCLSFFSVVFQNVPTASSQRRGGICKLSSKKHGPHPARLFAAVVSASAQNVYMWC